MFECLVGLGLSLLFGFQFPEKVFSLFFELFESRGVSFTQVNKIKKTKTEVNKTKTQVNKSKKNQTLDSNKSFQ